MQHEVMSQTPKIVAGHRAVPPVSHPAAIAGHGRNVIADSAADPLEINALLFNSGEKRCLLMSFDLLYVGGAFERQLRGALAARYAFADSEIVLFASHTHFAPPTDASLPELGPCDHPYAACVLEAALELVSQLVSESSASFTLEVRRGELAHSVNRRRPRRMPSYTRSSGLSFPRATFAPNPAGPRDPTATVITFLDSATRRPIAAIWHYACHPVGHTPSNMTSADFPGAGREALRRVFGQNLPVLYLQGFCGDLRPNIEPRRSDHWREALRNAALNILAGTELPQATEATWRTWVSSLSEGVSAIAAGPPQFVEQPARLASACVTVPVGSIFEGSIAREAMRVCGLSIGRQVEILALGAEPSVGWQRRLTDALGEPKGLRLYVGYCGDVFGYLPLPEQVDEGGYEVKESQRLFGLRGRYRKAELERTVTTAVGAVVRSLQGERPG